MPRKLEVDKADLTSVQTTLGRMDSLWSELGFTVVNSLPPNVKNKINSAVLATKAATKAVADFSEKLSKEKPANTV